MEVRFDFPLGGKDTNWAYSNQPKQTSPDLNNVRAYSTDAERARGGTRPGLKRAYSDLVGGTTGSTSPIQSLLWLDKGFGDVFIYDDTFDTAAGASTAVNSISGWTSSSATLRSKNGYVSFSGDAHANSGTANYQSGDSGFGGDTWDNFDMQVNFRWNFYTACSLSFWTNSGATYSTGGSGGAVVDIVFNNKRATYPLIGYDSKLTARVRSGPLTPFNLVKMDSWSSIQNRPSGPANVNIINTSSGDHVFRCIGDEDSVTLSMDGTDIAKCEREQGECINGGFAMTMSTPAGASATQSSELRNAELGYWTLIAKTGSTTTTRELVAIGGKQVWKQSVEGAGFSAADTSTILPDKSLYSAAHLNGQVYIATGGTALWYNPIDTTGDPVRELVARKGELVQNTTGVVNWRNRLFWYGVKGQPNNYFASRVGDAWDYDYGAGDDARAIAGNNTVYSRIGNPIQAICSMGDNRCVFGCSREIWEIRGDPAAGGVSRRLTEQTGMLGQNAWCTDDVGNLYFFGEEGMYRYVPGSQPVNLTSERLPDLSGYEYVKPGTTGSTGEHYISMLYDADRHGINLYLTPFEEDTSTHIFYDIRNDSFFPEGYPDDMAPTCNVFYNSVGASYRQPILGGRDGHLYTYDDDQAYDLTGSTAEIDAHFWTRPQRLSSVQNDVVVSSVIGTLSSTGSSATYAIHGADTVEGVTGSSTHSTGSWVPGRNPPVRIKVRGGAHAIKVSSGGTNKSFAIESIVGEVIPGGYQR